MSGIWKTEAAGEALRARYAQFLAYWPAVNEQLRVATAQGETFVIASGPVGAPAVLLLHGSLSNSASWMGDVAGLAQHFRVYAIDMIGEPGFSAPSRPSLASEAYANWLDEVMAGLGVDRAALVGISLGGWLALDYATRRPERVSALALLCPGGVGRTKNVLLWAAPLLLLGPWGQKMVLRKLGAGAVTQNSSPAVQAFGDFMRLIQTSARPRRDALPRFGDAALRRLSMPILTILGAKDAMLDSYGTRDRLTANVPQADIRWLPEAGHFLVGLGPVFDAFLAKALLPVIREIGGQQVYVCPDEGASLAEDHSLSDLISELFGSGAGLVAIPLARLGPDFLRLSSGVAGQVLQKLVNYRFQVAVVGDVSIATAASDPLRDFVRESNRGTTVWFVDDLDALDAKLSAWGRA